MLESKAAFDHQAAAINPQVSPVLILLVLPPRARTCKALGNGVAELQLAWPFTPLAVDDLDEFIGRWPDG